MGKRLAGFSAAQEEIQNKNNVRIQQYQNEVDTRECEITRIKKIME